MSQVQHEKNQTRFNASKRQLCLQKTMF